MRTHARILVPSVEISRLNGPGSVASEQVFDLPEPRAPPRYIRNKCYHPQSGNRQVRDVIKSLSQWEEHRVSSPVFPDFMVSLVAIHGSGMRIYGNNAHAWLSRGFIRTSMIAS